MKDKQELTEEDIDAMFKQMAHPLWYWFLKVLAKVIALTFAIVVLFLMVTVVYAVFRWAVGVWV